ncbi:AEC family transporter [Flavilitoribacter nigricans]|uniref:Permease n=1 Tax=Flavilitoribacter nigricans (strain ATCC 23147 / DSM 23189 / NBRC 102662 / NCIMB 1420 / SS-2) TaxID=1122177 RepID=A0A2D0NG13_FLAN2|nr:permease [Flavilitoribacter nigricans]PHN07444.1 permease [Flavilitoribacter nigricans DSM 23189 = NBRC 102662]
MALQKTISFILLILIGVLLKKKLKDKEQLGGVKILILSIALPATIFVALLKIKIDSSLLFLPLLALVFNVIMLLAARFMLPQFGIRKDSADSRTIMLLLPSLAPGLSCFPFILEYLGEESLARAALTDVGNKVFVLILLYLLAMQWYYTRRRRLQGDDNTEAVSTKSRLKDLMVSLVREPVNMVIVTALVMLGFGWNLDSLPLFLQDSVVRMSVLMTPMVLLFIGMAVKFQKAEMALIFKLLSFRAGLAFLLSALFLTFVPAATPAAILLAIVFPQSACSFWPFAHMSAVSALESEDAAKARHKEGEPTFQLDLALNTLALSLPFSTLIILSIFSLNEFFLTSWHTALVGLGFLVIAAVPGLYAMLRPKEGTEVKSEPKISIRQLSEVER